MKYTHGSPSARNIGDHAINKRVGQIINYLSTKKGVLLDVGCGNGLYTMKLAESCDKVIGLDMSDKHIAEAQSFKEKLNVNIDLVRASAQELPFHKQCLDILLLIETLEHIPDQESAIKEACRVLKIDGQLVIYVPNKLFPFEIHGIKIGKWHIKGLYDGSIPLFSWAPHFLRKKLETARIYTKGEIVRLIKDNGFSVRDIDYYYPPLDKVDNRVIKALLKRAITYFERSRLTKRFGMSIFLLAQKI